MTENYTTIKNARDIIFAKTGKVYTLRYLRKKCVSHELIARKRGRDWEVEIKSAANFKPGKSGPKPKIKKPPG